VLTTSVLVRATRSTNMKILVLDIELAPNIAAVWGLFKQNINLPNLLKTSYTLSWAAKWLGEDVVYYDSLNRSTPKQMIKSIHKLLDQADAVIHFNGKRFDIPVLNREFVLNGLAPPSPYKHIDLLTTVRTQFRFTSNKLDHVCEQLGIGNKTKHSGADLWIRCMNKDQQAWQEMEDYNIRDVEMTEELYYILRPWIKSHPNYSVFTGQCVCPNCASTKNQKRGFTFSLAGKYQRYQCRECGTWYRGVKNLADRSKFVTGGV
jgi:hypothetical protein